MEDSPKTQVHINEFEPPDFFDYPNFDQFINLIHGENEDSICNFDYELINSCFFDNKLFSCPENPSDYDAVNLNVNVYDPSSTLSHVLRGKSRKEMEKKKKMMERKRRSQMKSSLVPNISKASIVRDAVSYVRELQAAKKLKAEVAGLEASLIALQNYQGSLENLKKVVICKKIVQVCLVKILRINVRTSLNHSLSHLNIC